MDFAIGLVNSVLNLPSGQVKIFWRNGGGGIKTLKKCNQCWLSKNFGGLVKRLLG